MATVLAAASAIATSRPSTTVALLPPASIVLQFAGHMLVAQPTQNAWPTQRKLQWCVQEMCLRCPADRFMWGDKAMHSLTALRVLSTLSMALMLILLAIYIFLPKATTQRSIFKVGYVGSAIALALAFMVGIDKGDGGQCYDEATRADALHVSRCLISGLLFVGGYLAERMWALLWTVDTVCLIVFDVGIFRKRPWILALIGIVLPASFALASIPWLRSDYGPVCWPSHKNAVLYVMHIPTITIDVLSVLLEMVIFGFVATKFARAVQQTGERRARLVAIKQTAKLLWRPLTFTLFSSFGMIAFVVGFVPFKDIYVDAGYLEESTLAGNAPPRIYAYRDCLYANRFDYNACSIFSDSIISYSKGMSPFIYAFVLSFWFFATAVRPEMLRVACSKMPWTRHTSPLTPLTGSSPQFVEKSAPSISLSKITTNTTREGTSVATSSPSIDKRLSSASIDKGCASFTVQEDTPASPLQSPSSDTSTRVDAATPMLEDIESAGEIQIASVVPINESWPEVPGTAVQVPEASSPRANIARHSFRPRRVSAVLGLQPPLSPERTGPLPPIPQRLSDGSRPVLSLNPRKESTALPLVDREPSSNDK